MEKRDCCSFSLFLLNSICVGGIDVLVNHKTSVREWRDSFFALLEVRMCEKLERKSVLVKHQGHRSQIGKSKPVEGF